MNENYLDELKKKNILVLGFARSGYKTALTLNKYGINVIVNAYEDLSSDKNAIELEKMGVRIISGAHPLEILENIDLIIKNPGIDYKIEILKEAKNRKIPIITEIELASLLYGQEIIALTGTNGKTTTTTLVYEILKKEYNNVELAGNIGYPLIEVMDNDNSNSTIVLEVSSFQLNGTDLFRPHIAVITNLEEAHIDYHDTKKKYHDAKKRIYKNQKDSDYLILNENNKKDIEENNINSKIIYYTTRDDSSFSAYISNGIFMYNNEEIFEIKKLSLPGDHNIENAINASIIAKIKNIKTETIRSILYSFKGVIHRMQFLGDVDGVSFYNDSKSTNVTSTLKALSGFSENVILIVGGKDRGIDFSELASERKKIKHLICLGESKNILEKFSLKYDIEYTLANKVADATKLAYEKSTKGDVILLSPACASWDQYKNFEERGNEFISSYEKILRS